MLKNGVYYTTRKLDGGGFGIVVSVWIEGEWIETDTNTTSWPREGIALDRAQTNAQNVASQNGHLPVILMADPTYHVM